MPKSYWTPEFVEFLESKAWHGKHKNPHAVVLGRLGGRIGGPARARKLTASERIAIARKGGKAKRSVGKQHRFSKSYWTPQLVSWLETKGWEHA